VDSELDVQAWRALVDTGSNITLVHPGVLCGTKGVLSAAWTLMAVQIRMVTGEQANMEGTKPVRIRVRGQEMVHEVCLAHMQDPCIIDLDLLACWGGAQFDVPWAKQRDRGAPPQPGEESLGCPLPATRGWSTMPATRVVHEPGPLQGCDGRRSVGGGPLRPGTTRGCSALPVPRADCAGWDRGAWWCRTVTGLNHTTPFTRLLLRRGAMAAHLAPTSATLRSMATVARTPVGVCCG